MTRLSIFDNPLFLGFDQFEQTLERLKKHATDGYPPYNIEQTDDRRLRLTLAVAGFTLNDLDVELDNNQLVIKGKQTDTDDCVYLYRGIASRQFQKTFVLADNVEVLGANLDNGLLKIDLYKKQPESNAQKIEISAGNDKSSKLNMLNAEDMKKKSKESNKN